MNTSFSNLWQRLLDKEYRHAFAALQLKRGVPFQIRALLKQRKWTQEKLAENAGLTQGVVSRAQDPDYGNLTINTINKIAAGFDVAFVGRYVSFSKLVNWFDELSEEMGQVLSFEDENRLFATGQLPHRRVVRRNRRRIPRSRRRAGAKVISIDTGKSSVPLSPIGPSVGQARLFLPPSDPASGTDIPFDVVSTARFGRLEGGPVGRYLLSAKAVPGVSKTYLNAQMG
jgi:transcriptional regulator with XRE-family HTH domain